MGRSAKEEGVLTPSCENSHTHSKACTVAVVLMEWKRGPALRSLTKGYLRFVGGLPGNQQIMYLVRRIYIWGAKMASSALSASSRSNQYSLAVPGDASNVLQQAARSRWLIVVDWFVLSYTD